MGIFNKIELRKLPKPLKAKHANFKHDIVLLVGRYYHAKYGAMYWRVRLPNNHEIDTSPTLIHILKNQD